MSASTLRLIMPQWQGGNEPGYFLGSKILDVLVPATGGPVETVDVPAPVAGVSLETEDGIVARSAVVRQAKAARAAIERHSPARIVTIGGDCLIDLAPIAYLREKYGEGLGVLWIDSHPDVLTPAEFAHSHAHVLGLLMGGGDAELAKEVAVPVARSKVMYAGLNEWMDVESDRIADIRRASAEDLAQSSEKVLEWIKEEGITHLAVHFDLDVLDPAGFRPLLFNKPDIPEGTWDGIAQGRMAMPEVVRLLTDVAQEVDVVGLAIAEHLPWDMIGFSRALGQLPLLGG